MNLEFLDQEYSKVFSHIDQNHHTANHENPQMMLSCNTLPQESGKPRWQQRSFKAFGVP